MKLGVAERLVLLTILPSEGDLTTLRVVRDLQAALSFTEEEHAAIKFKHAEERTSWEKEGPPKEVTIGPKASGVLREAIQSIGNRKQLKLEWLAICERVLAESEGGDQAQEAGQISAL